MTIAVFFWFESLWFSFVPLDTNLCSFRLHPIIRIICMGLVPYSPGQICQLDYCFKILTTLIPSAILFLSDFTSSSFPQFQCFLAFFNAIFAVLVDVFFKAVLVFFHQTTYKFKLSENYTI